MKLLIEHKGKQYTVSDEKELRALIEGKTWGDIHSNASWLLGMITGFVQEIEKGKDPMGAEAKPTLVSTVSGPISELEPFEFDNVKAMVHPPKRCKGEQCTIHNPSQHHMRSWPMILRETALIERRCVHDIGHPDPDSVAWMNKTFGEGWGVHGCDGCCTKKETVQ